MPETLRILGQAASQPELPPLLAASRGTDDASNEFLPRGCLKPTGTYLLAGPGRSVAAATPTDVAHAPEEIVLIELDDGTEVMTSVGRLQQTLARVHPEWQDASGAVPLQRLLSGDEGPSRDVKGAARTLARRVFTFLADLDDDPIHDWLRQQGVEAVEAGVGRLGARAVVWAVESRLKPPGLHRWSGSGADAGDLAPADPARLAAAAASGDPMLVFIHGTGSTTLGSFGDLARSAVFDELQRRFRGGVYAFEHRTMSESPIANALQLARQLPANARVSLVTHSRGGLVGDLLCGTEFDALIPGFRRPPNLVGLGDVEPDSSVVGLVLEELGKDHAQQRADLAELAAELRRKTPRVERYVRTASPARGTRLAGGNLDLFLSGLLALVGRVPFIVGSPIYAAFKRIVIEIVRTRTDAHLVPGIEAMLPDSPMAEFLARLPVQAGVRMAVIAGDIEGGSPFKRLGVLLTDTLIFESEDNDLVVDTQSMLAGIAPRVAARARFDRAADVSHFRYFVNPGTRDGLRDWLLAEEPSALPAFHALPQPGQYEAAIAAAARGAEAADLPVVVLLPGVMGSHLRRGAKDRVWMDPIDIAAGGLAKIAWGQDGVEAEALFDMSYGALCVELAKTHRVERFPYDWRQPLDVLGDRLAERLDALLKETARPVRLLAHSMGGLVVRACIHRRRAVMDAVMARDGARLVMMGTPHQGAHSMVENLVGKGDTLRMLVRLDLQHSMQEVLDLVGGFRGPLQLLPKRGFRDEFEGQDDGGTPFEFDREATWKSFVPVVKDFWFGDGRVAQPAQSTLDAASWLWAQDGDATPALPPAYAARSVYVFGVAPNTACGVRVDAGRLRMVGTPHGDGTVTWASGRIGNIGAFYYLPAVHGNLMATAAHFDAIVDLVQTGRTAKLETSPPASRALEQPRPCVYDAGPPVAVDPASAQQVIAGAPASVAVPTTPPRQLRVRVVAGDLRAMDCPVMLGHYEQDPIAGTEHIVDTDLLDGELTQRLRLGLYAGAIGTATAVLLRPNAIERQRGSLRGAVVAGLGPLDGSLTMDGLVEAARTAALRYLLHASEMLEDEASAELTLASVLLGYNSSANIPIEASVEAVLRGVMHANHRFREITGSALHIGHLDFVELYLDTAISAVYAVRKLGTSLAMEAQRQQAELACESELVRREPRLRLAAGGSDGYWSRLIVTAARDREDGAGDGGCPPRSAVATRLRFVYIARRARAETVQQQRQPGLVERLVQQQIHDARWNEEFGRTLYQLMLPHDLKETVRHQDRLVLVVDETSAAVPWELMLPGDAASREADRPLSVTAHLVRQLESGDWRRDVRQSIGNTALVVGDPSFAGFREAFLDDQGRPFAADPPQLAGARAEAGIVWETLNASGFEAWTTDGPVRDTGSDAARPGASQVIAALYRRPWRIVHIAAHGVFDVCHRDGGRRSGVLLSDGLLITAAEIDAMERVPDVVFLNCCHLGRMEEAVGAGQARGANKLAASLASELIRVGVRCVIAAGWAIDDTLAALFSETFYQRLVHDRSTFGDAVHAARQAVWRRDPTSLTWGAFQAYGEPDWRLDARDGASRADEDAHYASPEELLDTLARMRIELARRGGRGAAADTEATSRRLQALLEGRCPSAWLDLPEVQAALGATWYALGDFERACTELSAAVRGLDADGRVPLAYVAKLANAQARLGEQQGDVEAIRSAIERLVSIDRAIAPELAAGSVPEGAPPEPGRTERWALIGSAHKRMAAVLGRRLLQADEDPAFPADAREHALEDMRDAIRESAAAYRALAAQADVPYNVVNQLALEGLVAEDDAWRVPAIARLQDCGRRAAAAFARQPDVWEAVLMADALLAERLADGGLAQEGAAGDAVLEELRTRYAQTLANVRFGPVELDSIVKQQEMLATLLMALSRGARGDAGQARAARHLVRLRQVLAPDRTLPAWLAFPE